MRKYTRAGAGHHPTSGTHHALRDGNRIIPSCWFVDVYIRRHRKYQGLALETAG